MNRAEIGSYEPTGAVWRWTVAELVRPVTTLEKWHPGPNYAANRRGKQPQIRASYAKKLWRTICKAAQPLKRAEWINASGLDNPTDRRLASSAIVNLVNGKWVRETNGLFSKEPQ